MYIPLVVCTRAHKNKHVQLHIAAMVKMNFGRKPIFKRPTVSGSILLSKMAYGLLVHKYHTHAPHNTSSVSTIYKYKLHQYIATPIYKLHLHASLYTAKYPQVCIRSDGYLY